MVEHAENAAKVNDVLKILREKFVASCNDRLSIILTAAHELTSELNNPDALARIRRECHKIAGLAGSIGFSEIGILAEDIDIALKQDQVRWVEIESKVQDLVSALQGLEG